MVKARETNASRDEADHRHGFAAPGEAGLPDLVKTAMFAVAAGIITQDWRCVAEGQAMLEHAALALGLPREFLMALGTDPLKGLAASDEGPAPRPSEN